MILDEKKNKRNREKREKREKEENECRCASHVRMLAHYENGIYKYVCKKCALELFSREQLREQEAETDAASREDTWCRMAHQAFDMALTALMRRSPCRCKFFFSVIFP